MSLFFYDIVQTISFSSSSVEGGDASLYKVAMGISLGIALVLLLAFSVLLACFCVYYQRTRQQGAAIIICTFTGIYFLCIIKETLHRVMAAVSTRVWYQTLCTTVDRCMIPLTIILRVNMMRPMRKPDRDMPILLTTTLPPLIEHHVLKKPYK
jgi:hypothetical protein